MGAVCLRAALRTGRHAAPPTESMPCRVPLPYIRAPHLRQEVLYCRSVRGPGKKRSRQRIVVVPGERTHNGANRYRCQREVLESRNRFTGAGSPHWHAFKEFRLNMPQKVILTPLENRSSSGYEEDDRRSVRDGDTTSTKCRFLGCNLRFSSPLLTPTK